MPPPAGVLSVELPEAEPAPSGKRVKLRMRGSGGDNQRKLIKEESSSDEGEGGEEEARQAAEEAAEDAPLALRTPVQRPRPRKTSEMMVPSPKTPEEERGGCARTLGQSLIDRYHQQRRENLSVRRTLSLTLTLTLTLTLSPNHNPKPYP